MATVHAEDNQDFGGTLLEAEKSDVMRCLLALLFRDANGVAHPPINGDVGDVAKLRIVALMGRVKTRSTGVEGGDTMLVIPALAVKAVGLHMPTWDQLAEGGLLTKTGDEYVIDPETTKMFLDLVKTHTSRTLQNIQGDLRNRLAQFENPAGRTGGHK